MKLEAIEFAEDQAGDPAGLDEAHQELFDLYNRIVRACERGTAVVLIRERVRTFLMYASWHFALEEECMRELRYPDRADHKADHGRLLQDAEDFVANLGYALKLEDVPAVARYFNYWLVRHTVNRDEHLRAFLKQGRAG
jgi:hemerythrin